MKIVVQEEVTGCGIATVANLVEKTYAEVRQQAARIGVFASDPALWSDTQYVRRLLHSYSVETSDTEQPFESWEALPNLALLSIKHHQENGVNYWHWVLFKRFAGTQAVLDSAPYLKANVRTDFAEMHPKWFIAARLPG